MSPWLQRWGVLLLPSIFMLACVPVPVISPPVKVELGSNIRTERIDEEEDQDPRSDFAFPARVGIAPLSVLSSQTGRSWDASVGYQWVGASARPVYQGPFVDGTYFFHGKWAPFTPGARSQPSWRYGSTVKAHYLTRRLAEDEEVEEREYNLALSLQVHAEFGRFHSGAFEDRCALIESGGCLQQGQSHGEGGFGLYLEYSYHFTDPFPTHWVGVGFLIRIPASAGIGHLKF